VVFFNKACDDRLTDLAAARYDYFHKKYSLLKRCCATNTFYRFFEKISREIFTAEVFFYFICIKYAEKFVAEQTKTHSS
jgi:hypothetical protein